MSERWGVVGGGMLGMALALWLADRGEEVTLIEGADHLGGLASPWQIGEVTWDRHYHVILNSDAHVLALLDRLGLTDDIRWVETRTGVLADGELHSVSNVVEYLRFPGLNMVDKLRMGWTILYGSRLRDWRTLEKTSVESWLRKHSGDRAFERFWRPLLRSKLGDNYERTSAAFIWTTIQRLYAARRSGLKKEMFGYVSGGYDRIIRSMESALTQAGVKIRTGERVRSVTSADGVRIVTDAGESTFDRVVLTTAAPLTARLVEGLDGSEQETMTGVEYQGIVCASLLSDRPLGGFYVTNITDPAPFTGVIEMTALVDPGELGGHHLVYLPRYTTVDDEILSLSDEEIETRFVGALAQMFPGFTAEHVSAFKVSRVPFVFPIPTLGYSERIHPMVTSVPGVYAVNSSQILNGTLNVNETLQLATRALGVLTDQVAYDPTVLERSVAPVGR